MLDNEENIHNFEASGEEISPLASMNGSWVIDTPGGNIHRRSKRAVRDAEMGELFCSIALLLERKPLL